MKASKLPNINFTSGMIDWDAKTTGVTGTAVKFKNGDTVQLTPANFDILDFNVELKPRSGQTNLSTALAQTTLKLRRKSDGVIFNAKTNDLNVTIISGGLNADV